MKDTQKFKNRGDFGWSKSSISAMMSPFDTTHTTSYAFSDCSRYSELFVESRTFFLYLTRASQGLTPLEFRQDVWHQKTRVSKLLCSIISRSCVYPFSRFRQNTDLWQTDRL